MGPGLAGEGAGAGHELVRHQVVADERHPAVDPGMAARDVEHEPLAVEHLVDGPGERRVGDVPAPRPERAADPDVS